MADFGSTDDFFAAEEAARNAADERVQPHQILEIGDCYVATGGPVNIYGQILDPTSYLLEGGRTVEELDEEERAEYDDSRATYAEPHMQYYRFTRSYSRPCRDGELGDIHLSRVTRKLTNAEFEAARLAGWP